MNTTKPPTLNDPSYRIEAEIGSGGGGVVYKAWHTRLEKYVVIKELKHGSKNDAFTQRNEVEALKNIKSAYLPQVYDFLTEGNSIFTVIEYVEGESLDKVLRRGQAFPQTQVIKCFGQLTEALMALHGGNVCHRDIKPANIMLTPSGDVCLIDLGAALVGGNDVRIISRSLGYASPEQYAIYEHHKNSRNAPIHLGTASAVNAWPTGDTTQALPYGDGTTALPMDDGTTALPYGDDTTALPMDDSTEAISTVGPAAGAMRNNAAAPNMDGGVDWRLSDIYSLGATVYHLLSGTQPPERADETVPISQLGDFNEGIVHVIEKSMSLTPSGRYASTPALSEAIRHIHKHDARWRASQLRKAIACVLLPLGIALFASVALYGRYVMAQEKEGRFHAALSEIENGEHPHDAHEAALSMYWDRIEPYRAMAGRLLNDGDLELCRAYIEENLGHVAAFWERPEAARAIGDIYYILGNCHYLAERPDYDAAKEYFQVALGFVTDMPAYYRDYAIALARSGEAAEAGRVLEQAQALGLEADSLALLRGEIAYGLAEHETALGYYMDAIATSGDDYLRYRAYRAADEILKLLGRPGEAAALLAGALDDIPLGRVPEMTERLADAYVKSGDHDSAIRLFSQLTEAAMPPFHVMEALAILCHNAGELEQAGELLMRMADLYPGDYRVPLRLSYLEADKQSLLENEERDYHACKAYHDMALALYEENRSAGAADPEMQRLSLLIGQLRDNGWLEEE